ncbi:MAG: transglycosylase domain-containing protein [Clostridia bacterium]|nr:transglycosylase domain-containing protein [Clostridia bacterium]
MFGRWRLLIILFVAILLLANFQTGDLTMDLKGVEIIGQVAGWPDLDRTESLTAFNGQPIDEVNGKLVVGYEERNINYVPLERIPWHLRMAFIAVEDSRFHDHKGIDPWGLARAAWVNLRSGEYHEGGSTITQQLAKNLFLSNEKTMFRKAKEAYLALQLEKKYTKDEILEMYLNQIYFGSGAYGVDSASRKFFGLPVGKLNLAQGAMLAGLPKNPAGYNPLTNREAARRRQWVVLDRMVAMGYITREEASAAKKSPVLAGR